jgi:predicted AAA+ superfamily ATPase
MTTLNGPGNPLGVAQDFLRTAPPSVALETLRALQARAGFKQTDKLNSRTAALVSTWRAFNALLERIEHQQVLDPQWGGILSSIMFAVQSLAEVGRTREARDSIQFLRSKYRLEPSGSLRVEVGSLKTTKDFELIAEAMQEFDAAYGDTPLPLGWPRAAEIDIERFHRTWLSGVVLCTEAAFREVPDVELSRIAEAVAREQLPTGAFYPERAVWSTARVCLGLAACGRSIHTDRVLKKAIDWLLTPGERGGARDAGIWRSGTGRWNTDLEVTSMAVLACLASGVQSDDERLRPAMRFLISQRDHWITPGSELDGALAAQAYLEAGGAWDEISGQVRKLSEWAQGEAFWHTATLTSTESLEQSCRVAQTASHLLSIGWSALRADLPVLLHALEMPERPVTEAITSQRTPQEHDLIKPNSPLASPPPETSEYTLVASVEKISSLKIEDLSVVNNYCRFDPKTRNQLKDWQLRICQNFRAKTRAHENFLIWAAPGSGKSYFITEIAASLAPDVTYSELNLAKQSQEEFSKGLDQVAQSESPVLCMVDEVDARRDDLWPYEILFSHLDANLSAERTRVFVLIGSSRAGKNGMIQEMLLRSKGTDLLDRIPVDRRFEIPPMCLEDRGVVFTSSVREAARQRGQSVTQIERFALYYVLSAAELTSPRQLRDLAYSAVGRLSSADDRLHYDSLFPTGDRRNQQFWGKYQEAADRLSDLYVDI